MKLAIWSRCNTDSLQFICLVIPAAPMGLKHVPAKTGARIQVFDTVVLLEPLSERLYGVM